MFQIFVLSKMDHEDSNSGFELFSSQPDKREFEKAPEETILNLSCKIERNHTRCDNIACPTLFLTFRCRDFS